MFKRRVPLTRLQKLREWVWPSMGLVRAGRYTMHRLMRIKDTTHKIALGLAMGLAISFTPVPGTHIAQAIFFTWVLRGNVIAALIGTLAGNPLTLPFMWLAAYKVGALFYALLGLPIDEMPAHFTMHNLTEELMKPWGLFMPWLIGGYILGVISLFLSYGGFYWLIRKARQQRILWKQLRVHQMSLDITEKHS